jgi:hypothetical protein
MTWSPLSKPTDKAEVNGVATPGYCEVLGANSPRKWDEQQGYGYSGAWLIYHGNALCHFSLSLRLFDDQDWIDWDKFRPLVTRTPPLRGRPKAMSIVHPVLDQVGVLSMVVEDVLAPVHTGAGEWTIDIRCIEWRAPKIALAKPDAPAVTENDPVEAEIKLKKAQLADLLHRKV